LDATPAMARQTTFYHFGGKSRTFHRVMHVIAKAEQTICDVPSLNFHDLTQLLFFSHHYI
jgi:hypothetical protein